MAASGDKWSEVERIGTDWRLVEPPQAVATEKQKNGINACKCKNIVEEIFG